ncbi:methyltransferase domain-containing protein [Paenibacillus sp. KS-LC4]|uniref:methyltransferase domain-containing protein n=1 Tax=Paenibacillus sp. KS-LC4 TaxID=2979727 RepID=UPI0030D341E0
MKEITSIILVTRNQLDYTKQCVDSIRKHTEAGSYELLLIDNGSDDGTVQWALGQPDMRVTANAENEGFPKGCNQGLEQAIGSHLLLLNNDTVVTPGWLEGLKEALLSDSKVGAVGPVTNSASYWSEVSAEYASLEELDAFAQARRGEHGPHRWEERVKLVGFCLLLRRSAYEAVGGLDESFGIGNFEDDDYSLRLRLAGYKLLLCEDTFIHHRGGASFKAEPALYQAAYESNRRRFMEKWGFQPTEALVIRSDMVSLIEPRLEPYEGAAPARLLEIGCGCGATLLRLKKRLPRAELFGVEKNTGAAQMAAAIGVTVYDTERLEAWGLEAGSMDGIMIGDAHQYGNLEQLKQLAALLKPGGWLIGSFANRHYYRYIRHYLAPDNYGAQQQAACLYGAEQLGQLYGQAGFVGTAIALVQAGQELAEQERRVVEGLEQVIKLTNEELKGRLTASELLAFGRRAKTITAPNSWAVRDRQSIEPSASYASDEAEINEQGIREQNDVVFSGERLVINREVKQQYKDVYEEHLARYTLASHFVDGLRVLDAACGAGYGAALLKRSGASEVVGIDIDDQSVKLAQRDYGEAGVSFAVGDVLQLPFDEQAFDAVVSFETIEHVANGAAWIAESARVLKTGGLFIVSTPNRAVTNPALYFEEQPFNPYHQFEYRTAELAGELLLHYNIVELYGQNPVDDSRMAAMNGLRRMFQLEPGRNAERVLQSEGHELIPLSRFKSCEPMYVVAVCRKK